MPASTCRQREASVDAGLDAFRRADDLNAGVRNTLSGRRVDDATDDATGWYLLSGKSGCNVEQRAGDDRRAPQVERSHGRAES